MGLLDRIFGTRAVDDAAKVNAFFKALNAYSPSFTTRQGGLYEMELTRSAVHAFAKHCAKLKPEVTGSAQKALAPMLQFQPNDFMDTTKFLYRLATILKTNTTAFIVPILDPTSSVIEGFYPLLPSGVEILEYAGEPWLRYTFANGQRAAIELRRVGILTTHQYKDDFFGDGNGALAGTLDLLDMQRQGMSEAIKSSAFIRFLAKLSGTFRTEDIEKERKRFIGENLSVDNQSGVLMFDQKYDEVKSIESKPWVIDAEQMKLIKDNVYGYFGVNDDVLQNKYDEQGWNAFYESEVEYFALQLGLVLSNMVFSRRERAFGNAITFSSNRLQYASNSTKLQVVRDLTDRGLMSDRVACDIFNMPYPQDKDGNPRPERWVIRGEYIDVSNLPDHTVDQAKDAANQAALKAAAEAASNKE